MILVDIAKDLKENRGYEEVPVPDLVDVLRDGFTSIAESLVKEGSGASIQIPRFGSFKLKVRAARTGFNPQTKEKIPIPAKTAVSFKPSMHFKESLASVKPVAPKKKATKKTAKKATKKTTKKSKKK